MRTLLLAFLLTTPLLAIAQRVTVTISTNTVLAQGDILVWSGSAWVVVNKGTNGQVLKMSGTNLTWGTDETGGSGGDVISTANNNFSGTNNFSAPINAATLTVNDDAYAAGWDGSTNVPTKNAVYDKIESLTAGSGGDIYSSSNNTFTATNTFQSAAVFGGITRRNWIPTPQEWFVSSDGTSAALTTAQGFIPWGGATISSGTAGFQGGTENHPSIIRLTSAAGANSGYYYQYSTANGMVLTNGYFSNFIFRPQSTNFLLARLGYHDSLTAPVDGAFIAITNNILSGVCLSNSIKTVTSTTYTIESNAWYTAGIGIVSGGTANFQLTDESGTVLWSSSAAGAPLGTSRALCQIMLTVCTNANAHALMDIDYIDAGSTNSIPR